MKKRYYIDTCIWLNLFKKEVDSKSGIQYWKFAKDLIEEIVRMLRERQKVQE